MCKPSTTTSVVTASPTGFDPEVMGGDTCALGECCMNPCGFLVSRLVQYMESDKKPPTTPNTTTTMTPSKPSFTTGPEALYILGCYGGWCVIFGFIYPLLTLTEVVAGSFHKLAGYVVFAACLVSWIVAKTSLPGNITAATLRQYDNYPYDEVLYFGNVICPTLHIRKLARSKYDRYSRQHVPRFDHHCPVLRRTIGEENYRHFLVFLTVHCSMCWYGAVIVAYLSWEANKTPSAATMDDPSSLSMFKSATLFLVILSVLLAAAGAGLTAFLGFHVYIISRGMTTNEYYKWKAVLATPTAAAFTKASDEEAVVASVNNKSFYGSSAHNKSSRRNIYHLGIWKNFGEVFYPRSLRNVVLPKKDM